MRKLNRQLKGYRVLLFNLFCACLTALPEFLPAIKDTFSDRWYLILSIFCAVGNAYLRTLTTTPVGQTGE